MISRTRTPKLKISDFTENSPSIAYSGAMYPLIEINRALLLSRVMEHIAKNSSQNNKVLKYALINLFVFEVFVISRTHKVPITRFVFAWFCPTSNALANPKSDILGFMSRSSRTLLALRSL